VSDYCCDAMAAFSGGKFQPMCLTCGKDFGWHVRLHPHAASLRLKQCEAYTPPTLADTIQELKEIEEKLR
jgi:hypothetical protein